MYAILGEGDSDVKTLAALVRTLAGTEAIPIKIRGYGSCGELVKKASKDLRLFSQLKYDRFIVCHDADGPDASARRKQIQAIVDQSGVNPCCVLIPVQELEAWILADVKAVTHVFSGWTPVKQIDNPEQISSPKEYLVRLSKYGKNRFRYDPVNDNPRVAKFLDLKRVAKLCPSFRPLVTFVVPTQEIYV